MTFVCRIGSYKTECEELAEMLLPSYLESNHQHSRHGIAQWVDFNLGHETPTVIANVTHHLQEMVFQRYK